MVFEQRHRSYDLNASSAVGPNKFLISVSFLLVLSPPLRLRWKVSMRIVNTPSTMFQLSGGRNAVL